MQTNEGSRYTYIGSSWVRCHLDRSAYSMLLLLSGSLHGHGCFLQHQQDVYMMFKPTTLASSRIAQCWHLQKHNGDTALPGICDCSGHAHIFLPHA